MTQTNTERTEERKNRFSVTISIVVHALLPIEKRLLIMHEHVLLCVTNLRGSQPIEVLECYATHCL